MEHSIFYYKDDGKEHISGNSPAEITLEQAIDETNNLPTTSDRLIDRFHDASQDG